MNTPQGVNPNAPQKTPLGQSPKPVQTTNIQDELETQGIKIKTPLSPANPAEVSGASKALKGLSVPPETDIYAEHRQENMRVQQQELSRLSPRVATLTQDQANSIFSKLKLGQSLFKRILTATGLAKNLHFKVKFSL